MRVNNKKERSYYLQQACYCHYRDFYGVMMEACASDMSKIFQVNYEFYFK